MTVGKEESKKVRICRFSGREEKNSMKKLFSSLPAKLLIGMVIGIIVGLIVPESVMVVLVPIKNIMGQVISFIVPLIVIGFIAPSITKLGNNASKLLGVALIIAYASSVLAAPHGAAFLRLGEGITDQHQYSSVPPGRASRSSR